MTTPESPAGLIANADDNLRSRRLMQITNILICAFAFGTLQFSLQRHWKFGVILFIGIALLLGCQWLCRRGAFHSANLLLLTLIVSMSFLFIWEAEGLLDEAILALPVLLVMTCLFVGKRYFFSILACILLFNVAVFYANQLGWRHDTPTIYGVGRLVNIELILLVGGLVIWIVINDLHNSLKYLKTQINNYHESEKKLTYRSRHDELTGLPNRVYGREMLEQAVAQANKQHTEFALLFVDLDHFKVINDSLGHLAGDRFLIQMAERLTLALPDSDIICRLGGDEFLIGITDASDLASISAIAAQLLTRVGAPLMALETEVIASCSIGIALFPKDGADFDSLLSHADLAMYAAKQKGRNAFQFYDGSLNILLQENLKLISGLRSAQAKKEFVLHYQPVFDLSSGDIVGAEALVRWNHPEKGLLNPVEFIAAAEKSGIIHEIGLWVINEACRQMVAWQAAGVAPAILAVNLSPVQFRRGNLSEIISNALLETGLHPGCLEFELTESTVIEDPEHFVAALRELKSLGVKIAIDDFGTGYSNLSYLQRFSVDKLKIDQSFVKQLQNGAQDQAIVTAIIQLAKSLNLKTVAEGIENEMTFLDLVDLGCDYGQGFWMAKPHAADEFFSLLKSKAASKAMIRD